MAYRLQPTPVTLGCTSARKPVKPRLPRGLPLRQTAGRPCRRPATQQGSHMSCRAAPEPCTGVALVLSEADRYYYRSLNGLDAATLALLQMPLPTDFYQLLGLTFDNDAASSLLHGVTRRTRGGPEHEDIKVAYRRLQKLSHPDIAGEAATDLAALLNLAYTTLSDPNARAAYDSELKVFRRGMGMYDGRPVSRWAGPDYEKRAIFVDETSCIGCTQCTAVASNTFHIEDEYGRARVHTQWGDEEEYVKEAVGACPVDCIHYVDRQQLPLLEYVMKSCQRENVALMGRRRSGNMGMARASESPFFKAEAFLRARKTAQVDKVLASTTARMQDDALAAAISRAWLALPDPVRRKGWPEWSAAAEAVVAEAQAAAAVVAA